MPFLIAMVLLVTAGLLGLSTPLPRRGAEIILDPERIRIAAGTSRESPFWWKDRPRVVGGGPAGAVLVEIHPVGRVRARLDTLPLTHAQLQRVVEFYSSLVRSWRASRAWCGCRRLCAGRLEGQLRP